MRQQRTLALLLALLLLISTIGLTEGQTNEWTLSAGGNNEDKIYRFCCIKKKVKPLRWDIFMMKFYSEILTLVFGITRLMIMMQASLLKLILEGTGPDRGYAR